MSFLIRFYNFASHKENIYTIMSTSKHPKGLYLVFATSTAERFSYYGMRAIFILFLTQALLFDKEHAASIYGSYTGLVYLTPLIGGYIADKYWGIRRSVFWGAMMMAVGQFLMFFSASMLDTKELSHWLMYGGLTFLILGNGCFKPTVSSLVGQLYEPGDRRLDSVIIMFPISLLVQKNSIKMVKMKPELDALRYQYVDDKDAYVDAQSALYKKEKYSPMAGVWPLLLQLPIIFGLLDVVYKPLKHLLHISADTALSSAISLT